MAVSAMARSMGKNKANTGTNMVPNPKPEKRVKPDPNKATMHIMI